MNDDVSDSCCTEVAARVPGRDQADGALGRLAQRGDADIAAAVARSAP